MAGRGAGKVSARDRARAARARLDADRAARDRRIEESATAYYAGLEAREAAEAAAREAETAMAGAVAALLGEGESIERVAALCDTTEADVRRLRRLAATDEPSAGSLAADELAGSAGSVEVLAADPGAGVVPVQGAAPAGTTIEYAPEGTPAYG